MYEVSPEYIYIVPCLVGGFLFNAQPVALKFCIKILVTCADVMRMAPGAGKLTGKPAACYCTELQKNSCNGDTDKFYELGVGGSKILLVLTAVDLLR